MRREDIISVAISQGGPFHFQTLAKRTSNADLLDALSHAHMVVVLIAPYGSKAKTALVGWKSANVASARKAQEEQVKEKDKEIEKEKPKPALLNPCFVSLKNPKNKGSQETALTEAALAEYLWCKVDSQSLMPGDNVTFTLFQKGVAGEADEKLVVVQGGVSEGRSDDSALAGWKVSSEVGGKVFNPEKDEIYFIAKQQSHSLETRSGKIKIGPLRGDCAEVHDSLFDHNSALMALSPMNDKDAFHGLTILAEAIAYSMKNRDRDCVIYGHADTTGDAQYNMEISKLRAESVKALLDGNKNAWVNIAQKKGSVESLEKYLLAFHHAFGWDCDPGIVDHKISATTQAAIRNFQTSFNAEHEGNLRVTWEMDTETWGAIFHVIYEQLGMLVEAKGVNTKTAKVQYNPKEGGVVACGEKYPLEAKEKDGFKSQKNRRVEIAFVQQGKVMPKTRRDIRLNPIEIRAGERKAKESVKKDGITGLEMWCRHNLEGEEGHEKHEGKGEHHKEGKPEKSSPKHPRTANQNQILEVVPAILRGDEITLNAKFDRAPSEVNWTATGWTEEKKQGREVKVKVRGFRSEIEKVLPVKGVWAANFNPHVVKVSAKDELGNEIHGTVHAYPNISDTYTIDFSEKLKAFKKITESFKKVTHVLGRELELKYFEGKVVLEGGFKEDEKSSKAFFGFDVAVGFSPLFGGEMKFPIPIGGILEMVPRGLKDYAANVEADFDLSGEFNLNGHLIRKGVDDYRVTGGLSGSVKLGISMNAHIGKKLLELEVGMAAEISAKIPLVAEAEENFSVWKIGFEAEVSFEGLKGVMVWKILHGTWVKEKSVTLIGDVELVKKEKFWVIN